MIKYKNILCTILRHANLKLVKVKYKTVKRKIWKN